MSKLLLTFASSKQLKHIRNMDCIGKIKEYRALFFNKPFTELTLKEYFAEFRIYFKEEEKPLISELFGKDAHQLCLMEEWGMIQDCYGDCIMSIYDDEKDIYLMNAAQMALVFSIICDRITMLKRYGEMTDTLKAFHENTLNSKGSFIIRNIFDTHDVRKVCVLQVEGCGCIKAEYCSNQPPLVDTCADVWHKQKRTFTLNEERLNRMMQFISAD